MAEEENKEDKEPQMPERWQKLNLKKMVEEGWRPRILKRGHYEYLTLRFGNEERSLGRYTDENWDLLLKMFPKLERRGRTSGGGVAPPGRRASLLRTSLTKDTAFPKSFMPSLHTLRCFEELRDNGFSGGFSQFINDIIYTHFVKCRGVILTGKIYTKPQPYMMVVKNQVGS